MTDPLDPPVDPPPDLPIDPPADPLDLNPDPTPPSPTPRLQAIRDGMAAGRDMGIFRELVDVIDGIAAQHDVDVAFAGGLQNRITILEARLLAALIP